MSSDPWGIERGSWKDSIPLGASAEDFIFENPEWVLYLRKDPRFQCPEHYSQASEGPAFVDRPCSFCMGFGVRTVPQVIPCRISRGSGGMGVNEGHRRATPGYYEQYSLMADLPRFVCPEMGDLLCVVEWDRPTQKIGRQPAARILSVSSIFMIKQLNDHFERELGWFACGLAGVGQMEDNIRRHIPMMVDIPVLKGDSRWGRDRFWRSDG